MNKNIRMITEGAMMVAMIGAFLMIDRQLANVLENFLFWGFPLPVLLFTVKYGLRDGIICGICAIIVSFLFANLGSVFLVVCSVAIGVIYGHGVHQKKNNWWLIIRTFIVSLIYYFITTYLFASFFGYDMIEEGKAIFEMIQPLFQNDIPINSVDGLIQVIIIITLVLTPLLQTIVVHLAAVILLKRLKLADIKVKPLAQILMPKVLAWILIIIYGVSFLLLKFGNLSQYPELVEEGVLLAQLSIALIFVFFGMIACMILSALSKQRWLSFVALAACIFFFPIIMVIGMIDCATNFRRDFIRGYYSAR